MNTLTKQLESLNLPESIFSRLRGVGIRSVGGLCVLTTGDLLHLGLSVGEVTTVQGALNPLGLRLSMDMLDEWASPPDEEAPERSNEQRFADAIERLADAAERIAILMEKETARMNGLGH